MRIRGNRRPYETQPPWMARVKVGDVLKERSGRLRVVREVVWRRNGWLWGLTFTIAHCSWTGRCYTVIDWSALKSRGFRPTGKQIRLTKPFDRKILAAIQQPAKERKILKCCDVEGVG